MVAPRRKPLNLQTLDFAAAAAAAVDYNPESHLRWAIKKQLRKIIVDFNRVENLSREHRYDKKTCILTDPTDFFGLGAKSLQKPLRRLTSNVSWS